MRRYFIIIGLLFILPSCKRPLIPGTDIMDTPQTKAIIALLITYRTRYEKKDLDGIMSLISESFMEDNDPTNPDDDYDKRGLRKKLKEFFDSTNMVKLDITVTDIEVKGGVARVKYSYTIGYIIKGDLTKKMRFIEGKEIMVLVKESGRWYIEGGI